MQSDGLNVGDNQVKLLQKVEELTLYTIASDNEIKENKELLAEQKALISQQQKTLLLQQTQLNTQQAQIDLLIKQVTKLSK